MDYYLTLDEMKFHNKRIETIVKEFQEEIADNQLLKENYKRFNRHLISKAKAEGEKMPYGDYLTLMLDPEHKVMPKEAKESIRATEESIRARIQFGEKLHAYCENIS